MSASNGPYDKQSTVLCHCVLYDKQSTVHCHCVLSRERNNQVLVSGAELSSAADGARDE